VSKYPYVNPSFPSRDTSPPTVRTRRRDVAFSESRSRIRATLAGPRAAIGPGASRKPCGAKRAGITDVTTPALGAIVARRMSAARCSARSHARTGRERSISRASGSGITRHLQEKSRQARRSDTRVQRGRAQPQPRMPNASGLGSDRNGSETSKPRFRPHRTLY